MKKRILAALTAAVFVLLSVCSALPALAKTEKPAVKFDTPAGYNDNDYQKLVAFLEIEDENGVKNGEKISANYDPADPETWDGVEWDQGRVFRFYCEDCFLIGDLDLSGCAALETLYCGRNELTGLDVSGCAALETLNCYENELTELDVSANVNLTEITCSGNALTELDVSANTELSCLYCSGNALTELDVSSCAALEELSCYENALTELDVSGCAALRILDCYENALTELDVSGCAALEGLSCYENALTELDVSSCPELYWLSCSENMLTELDLTHNNNLEELQCTGNEITELDLTANRLFFKMIRTEGKGTIDYICEWAAEELESSITAVPGEGSEFLGWYNEEGTLISENAVLAEYQTNERNVVARFSGNDPIPGDSDGSGAVDTTDALYVLRCALNISGSEEDMLAACDMNGDGKIDTTDALLVLRLALGIS